MSLNRGKQLTWERVIPDIATKNEFLMHLLLALSGLDDFTHQNPCNQDSRTVLFSKGSNESMSSTDVDSGSLHTIIEHHQQGLRGLREALDGATEANVEVLATGSMLLSAFAFASLRLKDFDPSHADGDGRPRVDWLRLVRGAASIIGHNWASLIRGRLRKLFIFNRLDGVELDFPVTSPTLIHSKRLSTFAEGARRAISNLRTFSDDLNLAITNAGHRADSAHSPTCAQNERDFLEQMFEDHERVIDIVEDKYIRILHVIHYFSRVDSDVSSDLDILADIEDTAVISWPHLLPQRFISSLDSYPCFGILEGKSFTILVHLYLILAVMENTWYIGTTIDREVKKVNALVTTLGSPQLVELMQWPMEVVSS
ncbi:hypothetical protein PHISP_06859 [Aspergillus sp. HF37]|nr:hypothetical protein PHISP_06859 [Aspergillus sp. HF37]